MPQLFTQFAAASLMVLVCVVVHGFGLFNLSRALRSEAALERLELINPLSRRGAAFTLGAVIAMLALHGVEIWLFALVYLVLGAIRTSKQRSISRRYPIRPSATATLMLPTNGAWSALLKVSWGSSCSAGRSLSSSG